MRVLYNWLKEYVDIKDSPSHLVETFTRLGMEVEEVRNLKDGLSGLRTAVIEKVEPHPNNKNYWIVSLKLKDGEITCVSGSRGLKEGRFVFVALPGTLLPKGTVDKKDVHGILSEGNIVSLEDLGLEDKSETVFFPENADFDTDPISYLGLDDYLYDLYITPNRPDLLGYLGIAADLGAFYNEKIHIPPYGIEEEDIGLPEIEILDRGGCPRYTGRVIDNVNVTDSPLWMKKRLFLSGIRPISNIVDVTNYVLLELGHPLHAFDLNKVSGKVVVRAARDGESILALDGRKYELSEDTLVIADDRRPIAIAGVIGGEESSVSDTTEKIFLESAYFDPAIVARTVFKYNLRTESSIRFMKGADFCIPPMASNRAARLIREISGGRVSRLIDTKTEDLSEKRIVVRVSKVANLIGETVEDEQLEGLLNRLGFSYEEEKKGVYNVHIPSRRRDIEGEADIAEEYLRFMGFDGISERLHVPDNNTGDLPLDFNYYIRNYMLSTGFWEIKSVEFVSMDEHRWFSLEKAIEIANPLSPDMAVMRASLIPGILRAGALNIRYGNDNVRLFELGRVFVGKRLDKTPFEESMRLAVFAGGYTSRRWYEKRRQMDFYDVKGVLDGIGKYLRADFELAESEKVLDGFMFSADILLNGKKVGVIGEVSPKVQKYLEVKIPLFAMELDLQSLALPRIRYSEFSRYPSVWRDISILVPRGTRFADVKKLIEGVNIKELDSVVLVDIYDDKKVLGEKLSFTVALQFSSFGGTLESVVVEDYVKRILSVLKEHGYEQRT